MSGNIRSERNEVDSQNWFNYMPWWRWLLLRLIRSERGHFITGEDTHCFIHCSCGEELSAGDFQIAWCPKCGVGYSTEFKSYRYSLMKKAAVWREFKRYVKHPFCLVRHREPDSNEIGTDGKTLDYYCSRCQKVIKRVPVESNIDFLRLKQVLGGDIPNGKESSNEDT